LVAGCFSVYSGSCSVASTSGDEAHPPMVGRAEAVCPKPANFQFIEIEVRV